MSRAIAGSSAFIRSRRRPLLPSDLLAYLKASAFRDVAGTRISARAPISRPLLNRVVGSALGETSSHVRDVDIRPRAGDAFDVLEDLAKKGSRFDVVVIDPPAFAKRKKELPKALAAYKRLNHLAMQVIAADGILVSCSCSHHVSPEDLQDAIAKAARAADKHLQILEAGGQAPDHPVHPAIPETRYLKAYFCRVNESLK